MTPPLLIGPLALAAVALLALSLPHDAVAAGAAIGLHDSDLSAAKRQQVRRSHRGYVYVPAPARRAYGFRSDPSFDPYGRPWRPNFYAPCYEDLGYGRFRACSDIR